MTDSMLHEVESMLASRGWTWLQEQFQAEWGAVPFLRELRTIANSTEPEALKVSKTAQAWAAHDAVERFLRRPEDAVARWRQAARAEAAPTDMSRRGSL
jgi:hypothetical protein